MLKEKHIYEVTVSVAGISCCLTFSVIGVQSMCWLKFSVSYFDLQSKDRFGCGVPMTMGSWELERKLINCFLQDWIA